MMIEFDTIYKISPNYRRGGEKEEWLSVIAKEYNIKLKNIVSSFLLLNGISFPLFDLLGKREYNAPARSFIHGLSV